MKTYILPGFSETNKDWVDKTVADLLPLIPARGVYWPHWKTGRAEAGWIEEEVQKIIADSKGEKINIIAKSVGTLVVMTLLKIKPNMLNKIILCGIPYDSFSLTDRELFDVLKNFSENDVLCIQNESDTFGSYKKVKEFINFFNPKISVISKPYSGHDYFYQENFIEFLKTK